MKTRISELLSAWRILAVCFIILLIFPTIASSEEIYVFERMWPALQEPWYFFTPSDIAVDSEGYIYVVDLHYNRITKLK